MVFFFGFTAAVHAHNCMQFFRTLTNNLSFCVIIIHPGSRHSCIYVFHTFCSWARDKSVAKIQTEKLIKNCFAVTCCIYRLKPQYKLQNFSVQSGKSGYVPLFFDAKDLSRAQLRKIDHKKPITCCFNLHKKLEAISQKNCLLKMCTQYLHTACKYSLW